MSVPLRNRNIYRHPSGPLHWVNSLVMIAQSLCNNREMYEWIILWQNTTNQRKGEPRTSIILGMYCRFWSCAMAILKSCDEPSIVSAGNWVFTLTARFMGRIDMGLMLAKWTLQSGQLLCTCPCNSSNVVPIECCSRFQLPLCQGYTLIYQL